MEQILASRALTDDERAQLLYERGVLYDSLGLRALAVSYTHLLSHPQQCGTGVQTAGKSDTNTLTYREMLENRRHKITPCLIN